MLRRLHPVITLNFAITAAFVVAAVFAPDAFLAIRAKREGPIEHVSHVALLAASVVWLAALRSLRGRKRRFAIGVAGYVLLLLLEEIDWGLVYGLDIGFKNVFGVPSFHQTTWENEYVWQDKLYWFGAPIALFFVAPWLGRWTEGLRPVAPTRADGIVFVVVLATFLVVDQFHRHAMSSYQAVIYLLIAWVGAGAAGYRKLSAPESAGQRQASRDHCAP